MVAAIVLAACARQGTERSGAGEAAPPAAPPAAAPSAPAPVPEPPRERPGRALTAGERDLLRPLFRDSVDYDAVRVIPERFIAFQPSNVYMTPEGNIYAPGRLYRDDFSADDNVYLRAVFVHEVLHVWQHQSGMNLMSEGVKEFLKGGGNYEEAYPYTLAPERDLLDYGLEQQASMVEDYHLITAYRRPPERIRNVGLAGEEQAGLFAKVLGRFLADPRYARATSARAVAEKHAEEAKKEPIGAMGCDEQVEPPKVEHLCHWRFEPHGH
jgi:hypothetical protein